MSDTATQSDVTLDLLAIIDDAPSGRLVGSESTTIDSVEHGDRDTFTVVLDNGQRFTVHVREDVQKPKPRVVHHTLDERGRPVDAYNGEPLDL